MRDQPLVRAAGAVVWRYGIEEVEVLLVHRPRWDDWTFPKGKVDRGEHATSTAVREIEEETGLRVRLGPRLPDQKYTMQSGQDKLVHYWTARPRKRDDVSTYQPNDEIDRVKWFRLSKARERLTYPRDTEILDAFDASAYESSPLIVLRHVQARSRSAWRHDDSERPLTVRGRAQAQRLVPVLQAYGVTRIVTSDSVRCVDSVLPYANASNARLRLAPQLSEEHAAWGDVAPIVQRILASNTRTVICSHRPVIPDIFATAGVAEIGLAPASMVVLHRRQGKVLDLEQHD